MFLRRNPDLVYLTLRVVCLLYVVPVGYTWMQLTVKDGFLQADGLWQANFSLTGVMWILFAFLAAIWVMLSVHSLFLYFRKNAEWREIYGGNIPEEDVVAEEEFERIQKKLRIHRNVCLYRNDMINSPQSCGILRPCVLLPYREYSREELVVIFHHELMHYKSRDVLFKWCGLYVEITQHLNPFAAKLKPLLDEWSEYYCDSRAITAISDELDASRYFELILKSVGNTPRIQGEDYIFSMLYEDQLRLERRIDYMKKYMRTKKCTKVCTALAVFAFAMMSVTTTYAAGVQIAEVHDGLYENAEVSVADGDTETELEEIYLPAAEDHSYDALVYENPADTGIMPLIDENELVSFEWTIPSGTRHISNTFHVDEGQSISIATVATPSTCLCWIGIMDSWNNVRYVSGYEALAHTFEITDSGSYRVFVQNKGKRTVTASGSYYYFTPEPEEETETEE